MLPELSVACCLLAVTVIIHAAGLSAVLRRLSGWSISLDTTWRVTSVLVGVAWVLLALHLVEIGLWALFYWWQGCLPDLESSLYFSGVTYATLGYGDLLLPKDWRLLAPLEALTGILMSGLSVSFFFVVVSRAVAVRGGAARTNREA
jgi:Ion channel